MKIQNIIKNRRLELDLTMKQVANALGVTEATISRYESGEIQNMGIDKIEALSKILRCSPGYLMGWEIQDSSSQNLNLSDLERQIILTYRKSDAITKAMVLRALAIDEENTEKLNESKMA